MRNERVRLIVEIGLTVALAAVLNTIKLWEMPQGGSVSLVMLPLFVLALRRGVLVGALAGALYGVVDLIMMPVIVHWIQVALDYPVAFAGIGAAGIGSRAWRTAASKGTTTRALWTIVLPSFFAGATVRYVAHVVSGYVYFAEYARDANQPALLYSLAYNSFVLVAAALCFAAATVLLPIIARTLDQTPTPAADPA